MSAIELLTGGLLLVGALLMFIASLGLLRFPDPLCRASAASKSSTLGAVCILLAFGIHHAEVGADARALGAIVFLVLTAPVGAYAIGRAAYRRGDVTSESLQHDELAEHLNECEPSEQSAPPASKSSSQGVR